MHETILMTWNIDFNNGIDYLAFDSFGQKLGIFTQR
jgi:hypothetical protein